MKSFACRPFIALASIALLAGCNQSTDASGDAAPPATRQLLNVSYDPTRELYAEINPLFASDWQQKIGEKARSA